MAVLHFSTAKSQVTESFKNSPKEVFSYLYEGTVSPGIRNFSCTIMTMSSFEHAGKSGLLITRSKTKTIIQNYPSHLSVSYGHKMDFLFLEKERYEESPNGS
jgi:hypothetical protein